MEEQKHYRWFNRYMGDYPLPPGMKVEDLGKCDHAIRVPGCSYEVGIISIPEKPGTYKMYYDFWSSGGLDKVIGQNGGPLKSEYTHQVMKYLQTKGKAKMVNKVRKEHVVELTMTL